MLGTCSKSHPAQKHIGFVNAGQNAAVKIETFNYTKYSLIYATRVKINRNTMNIESKRVKLAPGMAVTVEIKTGQRRIIEYFLSPLIQYASEGLRER